MPEKVRFYVGRFGVDNYADLEIKITEHDHTFSISMSYKMALFLRELLNDQCFIDEMKRRNEKG